MSQAARPRYRCRERRRHALAKQGRWQPSPLRRRRSSRPRFRPSRPTPRRSRKRLHPRPSKQTPPRRKSSRRRECRRCRGWSESESKPQLLSHSGARAKRASPESITTIGSMDSGPAPSGASRNDDRISAPVCRGVSRFRGWLFLAAGSGQDQIGDLSGMRHQRQVTCLQLHRGRVHAFCQKSFEVGIDGLILLRYRIP